MNVSCNYPIENSRSPRARKNPSLSRNCDRCRSLLVVPIVLFCVNALTFWLKLSRCVYLKIKFFAATMLFLVISMVEFSLREYSF